MHITHALCHILLGRWRLTAATMIVAFCITLALAIGGTAFAASGAANPALQANMPATTAEAATTKSFQTKAAVSDWRYIGNYFWRIDCIEAGQRGVLGGAWVEYQCIHGSWWPWDPYELWVR